MKRRGGGGTFILQQIQSFLILYILFRFRQLLFFSLFLLLLLLLLIATVILLCALYSLIIEWHTRQGASIAVLPHLCLLLQKTPRLKVQLSVSYHQAITVSSYPNAKLTLLCLPSKFDACLQVGI